jgi:beta-mannanase
VFPEQSKTEPMSAESFLDRYSLPRIARLIAPKVVHDDQQQQKQQAKSKKLSTVNHYLHPINSSSTTAAAVNSNDTSNCDDIKADNSNNGELFLLYRHLKKYKVYHAVNAKSGTNRKKGIKIPQDFTGECRVISAVASLHNIAVDLRTIAVPKRLVLTEIP